MAEKISPDSSMFFNKGNKPSSKDGNKVLLKLDTLNFNLDWLQKKLDACKGAHIIDIIIRKDGQQRTIEGDFLKNITIATESEIADAHENFFEA